MLNTLLFDAKGKPTDPLCKLLHRLKVNHDGSLEGIRDATQKAWYQAGKLRAEITDLQNVDGLREGCQQYLAELGFVQAVESTASNCDYALVLGATVVAVRKRLAFLSQEWKRGVRFKEVVLFGNERPLLPDKEGMEVLCNWQNSELPFAAERATIEVAPQNEVEMMTAIYNQVDFPWAAHDVMATAVLAKGKGNTADTARAWLEQKQPTPGICLAVSSQPFVSYQVAVLQNELPRDFTVIGIGPQANLALPFATFLDNVAKLMYEIARSENE